MKILFLLNTNVSSIQYGRQYGRTEVTSHKQLCILDNKAIKDVNKLKTESFLCIIIRIKV